MSEAEKKQTRDQFADWFRAETGEADQSDPPEPEAAEAGYPIVKDAGEAQGPFYTPKPRDLFVEYMSKQWE